MLKLAKIIDRVLFLIYYKSKYQREFKSYGNNIRWGRDASFLVIPKSIRVSCPEKISLGSNTVIDEGVFLQCHLEGEGITIGDGVRVNAHTHIQAYSKITLEEKVLIAPFCLLHSGKHGNGEDSVIMDQEYIKSGDIHIGSGSWLGHGVKVLGGASISSNCTVAAGAIVTKKFHNRAKTLVGIPAKEI